MEKINVAIIGYGMSASIFHAPIINEMEGFCLKKIYERKSQNSKKDYPDSEVVHNIEDLFTPDIDLIIVTTPNKVHYEHAKLCLLHNKNVVVEKPFTASVEEARELIDISIKKNLVLTVSHNRRWDGDFLTVKKVLRENILGEVMSIESNFPRFRPEINDKWKEKKDTATGLVYDIGSHLIDQMLSVYGDPLGVFADIRIQRPNAETDDFFQIIMDYGKFNILLRSDMVSNYRYPRFVVKGTKGTFVKYGSDVQERQLSKKLSIYDDRYGEDIPENYGIFKGNIGNLESEVIIKTVKGNYSAFYENLYDRIINKKILTISPESAERVIYIIEKCFESNEKRKYIKI
ncbi:MAG: Gfo/Idh/MocA family oxidoreductase [Thermotogae bacterium]|nr:Gfo/Idh/MocA family oxidoreductase [Thermotogota bacterium]MCP5465617.1 Gfo/Idh/MocA family oxidoreductase [Thermotogota bacterium]HOO74671.1 Gfo/Idh/MocA family oxidoreductase [Tepiditoga sp.]